MKRVRVWLLVLGVCAVAVLATVFLTHIGIDHPDVHQATKKSKAGMNYVLVNEDTGGTYNNKRYVLGDEFMQLVSQDTKHNWHVGSLSVANAGFKRGDYDAEIIIPQAFTKQLIALQAAAPTSTTVRYRVRDGLSANVSSQIQSQVGGIVAEFNQRVVKMYFSSILDNVAEAQRNVKGIANGETAVAKKLSGSVQSPLNALPDQLNANGEIAKSTSDQYASYREQQANTNKTVQEQMTDLLKGIGDENTAVKQLADYEATMAQVNAESATLIVQKQKDADDLLYHQTADDADQQLDDLQAQVGTLQESLQAADDQNKQFHADANDLLTQLKAYRDQMTHTYLGYDTYDAYAQKAPDFNDKKTHAALTTIVPDGTANTQSLAAYQQRIQTLIAGSSLGSLESALPALKDRKLISDSDLARYQQELQLVQHYNGSPLPDTTKYQLTPDPSVVQSYTLPVTAGISRAQATTTFTLKGTGGTLAIKDPEAAAKSAQETIAAELGRQIDPAVAKTVTVSATDTGLTVTLPEAVQTALQKALTGSAPAGTTWTGGSTSGSEPLHTGSSTTGSTSSSTTGEKITGSAKDSTPDWKVAPAMITFSLPVSFSGSGTADNPVTPGYTLTQTPGYDGTNDEVVAQGALGSVVGTDQLEDAVPDLLKAFGTLDETSGLIQALYSDGSASSNEKINAAADQAAMAKAAPASSIYAVFTKEAKNTQPLTNDTDAAYQEASASEQGRYQLYTRIQHDLTGDGGVNSMIKRLETLVQQTGDADANSTILADVKALNDRFDEAKAALATDNEAFSKATVQEVTTASFSPDSKPSDSSIYDNTAGAQELLATVAAMASQAEATQAQITAETQDVQDVKSAFDQMTKTTQATQKQLGDTLGAVNQVIAGVTNSAKDTNDYAQNFGKVMNNAHTNGADNAKVFNFLTAPIRAQGTSGKLNVKHTVSIVPYLLTVLTAILTFMVGVLGRRLEWARKDDGHALELSRMWFNQYNLARIAGLCAATAVSFSLAVAWATQNWSGQWLAFDAAAFYLLAMAANVLMRGLQTFGIVLYGLVVGSYFLMSPLLGLVVQPSSWLEWLFKLSPFQNLENAYTVMVASGRLGTGAVIVIAALALLITASYLAVKPDRSGLTMEDADA
ncbi:MAG: type VII secretion protein EsaA [Lactobacillus sp.]|nr:type VII secretion protein EsaA [Lactobacillus sp.]MCI2033095.1 type VII secretion protein EsaA [Lactobacillus sp.]